MNCDARARLVGAVASLAACLAIPLSAQESPAGIERLATDWGEIRFTDRGLTLHTADARLPASGTVRIPRLNNPVAAVFLDGDKDRSPLKLTPHVAEWEIALPMLPGRFGRIIVVVETVGPPHLTAEPRVSRPSTNGVLTLAAHDAITHGQTLRYEPQPHKNTVGYWSRVEDWCEWQFVAPPGRYEVQIHQGCGKGQGGSEVALHIGGQQIVFTVEETGHFQNFKNRSLGTVELTAEAEQTLELRPRTKKTGVVMDVRRVRLIPVNPEP